jgi:hypothetical protein
MIQIKRMEREREYRRDKAEVKANSEREYIS